MTHLGFWTYLMSDCIMFGALFAVYIVLRNNTFGGPTAHEMIVPSYALIETLLFLTSSFCCCLMGSQDKKRVLFWLGVTFLLGLAVFAMGSFEFIRLRNQGALWEKSGFLSAFFTLVQSGFSG
jgi:cytochrome o ubiquinol oxidase subunit III